MFGVALGAQGLTVRRMPHGRFGKRQHQCGIAYLGVLLIVFLMSIGIGKSLEVYSAAQQRSKETELLYVGGSYRDAIKSYYQSSPAARHYPLRVDELLSDRRFPIIKRHLRKAYLDPMTGKPFDFLRSNDGRIIGVKSTSKLAPLRRRNFPEEYVHFGEAKRLSEWEFTYREER